MDSSFLPWFQKGKKVTRECTPVFRFEGKGVFSKESSQKQLAKWLAQNKSVAFVNIHFNSEESLDVWQPSATKFGYTKCLSTMFIRNIALDVHENSMGKDFEFGLYENEKRIRKITTFPSNTLPTFFSSDLNPGLSIKLDFDQDYAWGFQTVDHTVPTYNDSNFLLSFTISCEVVLGAGDP